PCRRHERQVDGDTDGRSPAPGRGFDGGRVHLAARLGLARAARHRPGDVRPRRRAGAAALRDGRGDPVRGADGCRARRGREGGAVEGGGRETAEAFLGRGIEHDVEVRLPGRLDWRGPDELWDGAHTPEGIDWLLARVPVRPWVVVASILVDKDADAMLERLGR